MNKCTVCGVVLPPRNVTPEQRKNAENTIKSYGKVIEDEGETVPYDVLASWKRQIYNAKMVLKGEYTHSEAICKKCLKRWSDFEKEYFANQNRGHMSSDKLKEIKKRGVPLIKNLYEF